MADAATRAREREPAQAAGAGDERAFRELVEPHRRRLYAHCYRMLGSQHDAEDAMQEALLRAWRGLPRFDGRSAFRTWLYRVATNVCLDAIARRPKRVLPVDYGPPSESSSGAHGEPLTEPIWIEPLADELAGVEDGYASPDARYDEREAIELAFVAALQRLPGRQRAVLILRDVLGFSAKETAEAVGATVPAVNGLLRRARLALDADLPERSQQETKRAIGDAGLREIVERFTAAFERGDVEAILELLTDDVTFAMPPYREWYSGRDRVGDSWLMPGQPPTGLRYVETRANGQLALGAYSLDEAAGCFMPIALDVLTLRGARIAAVLAFRTPEAFPAFGLPAEIERDPAPLEAGTGSG